MVTDPACTGMSSELCLNSSDGCFFFVPHPPAQHSSGFVHVTPVCEVESSWKVLNYENKPPSEERVSFSLQHQPLYLAAAEDVCNFSLKFHYLWKSVKLFNRLFWRQLKAIYIFWLMAGTFWKSQVSNQALKHKLSLNFCFLLRTHVWGEALRPNHVLSLDLHAYIYSDN